MSGRSKGRPSKGDLAERKMFAVYLSDKEKEEIKLKAEKHHRSLSEYLRLKGLGEIENKDINRMIRRIENFVKSWDEKDAYKDFVIIQEFYTLLCDIAGKEEKNLEELRAQSQKITPPKR